MIFRLLSLLSVAFCGVFTAFAEQLQVPDITLAQGGSAKLEISLGNEHSDLVAFQMDLTLPEGLSLDKAGCTFSSRITDEKQELVIGKLESGAFRLTSASMSLAPISGTEGPLLTLEIKSDENFVQGIATIGNILFATSGSERVALNDVSFTINTYYTLTYKVDGEEYKTSTVAYGTELTPEAAPSKEGYTFSGWSEIPETMPAKDVIVTGSFSVNSYTLTYMVDGEVYKTSTVAYGTELTTETEPSREGYTFSGWSEIPETMSAKDVVVTGTFSVNSYTLTYMVDGEVYKTSTVAYGTELTAEAEPSREGYTFSGWSESPETMPAKDVVVTGTFSVNSYNVTFKYGDVVLTTSKVEYGAVIPLPESLESDRYTLVEWLDVPASMPAHDIVIQASFTDGVKTIQKGQEKDDYYQLNGVKLDKLQKGMNIIRSADGTTRKVLVK